MEPGRSVTARGRRPGHGVEENRGAGAQRSLRAARATRIMSGTSRTESQGRVVKVPGRRGVCVRAESGGPKDQQRDEAGAKRVDAEADRWSGEACRRAFTGQWATAEWTPHQ